MEFSGLTTGQVINAMRPWMHESKLASHLDAQRAIGRARTPSTPTYQPSPSYARPEDVARLERIMGALQDLHQRLTNNDELAGHVGRLLTFLQEMRQDLPIQAPEQAFERLLRLRSWLFWLPPAAFRPDDHDDGHDDSGACAVLAHFFAVPLALDPLFPELGGAYLGSMSVAPIEEMRQMLLQRRAAQPLDTGTRIALAWMDTPLQLVNEYKARQQFLAQQQQQQQQQQQADAYRHVPAGPPAPPAPAPPRSPYVPLGSSAEMPPTSYISSSPVQSPPPSATLSIQSSSPFYSPPVLSLPPPPHSRSLSSYPDRPSGTMRPHLIGERSLSFNNALGPSTAAAAAAAANNNTTAATATAATSNAPVTDTSGYVRGGYRPEQHHYPHHQGPAGLLPSLPPGSYRETSAYHHAHPYGGTGTGTGGSSGGGGAGIGIGFVAPAQLWT